MYQIGSTTKAFTALGILWLEDEGLVSLDDPVSKYLPWFNMKYEGKKIPDEDITIANLVYQTSGFTNYETKYPAPKPGMTLEQGIQALSGSELTFYPSAQFAYANTNYNTLGLLIEVISGQTYQDFMNANIFKPLGLKSTYAAPELAAKTGLVIQGSRLAFFHTYPYETPVNTASVLAGYIISSSQDMSRWLQIQLGMIEVSPQMTRIINKSHQPDERHLVDENTRYACGWFVGDNGIVYHSGGTPNYSAKVLMKPEEGIAVCVLTNINASANTDAIADGILNILTGKPVPPFHADFWVMIDRIFTFITFCCIPLIVLAITSVFHLKKQIRVGTRIKNKVGKRAALFMIIPFFMAVFSIAMLVGFPVVFEGDWLMLTVWAPYSLFSGVITFALLSGLLLVVSFMFGVWPKKLDDSKH